MRTLVVVLAVLCGACVTARGSHTGAAEASPGEASEGQTAGSDDPVVCQREHVPGSRTKRRVCRHRSEIEAERGAAQDGLRGSRPQPPATESPRM